MRSSPRPAAPLLCSVLLVCLLAACAHKNKGTPDNEPTLKTLAQRTVDVRPDQGLPANAEQAIQAYRGFLDLAPLAPQREEAMRRIGDLEMDRADSLSDDPQGSGEPDYRAAVARYQELLKTFPNSLGNDRVLYQLARAQEQGGDLAAALATLERLVRDYPATGALQEAQFRRGELLFTQADYARAEQAYATVLVQPDGRFHDRALYMQGWSRFKQGKLDDALQSFFGVLDAKLVGLDANGGEDGLQGLSGPERELVEDTFRVSSLCLANLQGAESIAPFVTTPARRGYAYLVYAQLGALYLKQERVKDAADTFALFSVERPLDAQAPMFQARVIAIYEGNGFANLALDAKKEYVARYGKDSAFRPANPEAWHKAQPLVQTHLAELARHYHAQAQATRQSADYQQAVRWYRDYLAAFPADPQAARNNFLLAELLFEDQRFAEAAVEYEQTAYAYPAHADSAEAGYGLLLANARQQQAAASGATAAVSVTPAAPTVPTSPSSAVLPSLPALPALQMAGVENALRFVQRFPADARAAPVLADAADKLYALQQPARAAAAAQALIDLQPAAPAEPRRVAWTVLAHTRFEAGDFAAAESAYAEVLALTPQASSARAALLQRQAAAIYKQGEAARGQGQTRAALDHFERAARSAEAQSDVQQAALYDAAAQRMALKDWAEAARSLEEFRRRFPAHPLQPQVTEKLALAYSEQGQWAAAAAEFERMAGTQKDPELARAALWQAAVLQEKAPTPAPAAAPAAPGKTAGRATGKAASKVAATAALPTDAASRLYARYLAQYPQPLEQAQEARWAMARLAKAYGNSARRLALMKDILQAEPPASVATGTGAGIGAEAGAGANSSARSRYLAASAALALAEPVAEAYRSIALVEPLQKQLKQKRARMDEALKAYALATDYGVADVSTEASYQIATVYRDFGKALMASERPKKLNQLEREQYNVLLEEQAYPFEEKATEMYVLNAQRASTGLYDPWVQRSFEALRELLPVRFGKTERGDSAQSGAGVANAASTPAQVQAQALNQRGIAQRQAGAFAAAREAYEQALALDADYASAILNLGILQDLYLGDARRAQGLYERYLALQPQGDATVSKWLAEIKNRKEKP